MAAAAERQESAGESSRITHASAGPPPAGLATYKSGPSLDHTGQHTSAPSTPAFLTNSKASTAITETYKPRQVSFRPLDPSRICDEKVIRHDHSVARHYESQSAITSRARSAVQHRSLGSLSLIANLTRIRYGYWHDDPACLVGFRFQFLGSETRWIRFEKADISIRFSSTIAPTVKVGQESSSSLVGVGSDPEVVDIGPKHLNSTGTNERREWHMSAQLAASLPIAPVSVTPLLSAGISRSYERHYAASVEAAAFPSHGHTSSDTARFWIREDAKQKDGLPLEFDCAAIVTYAAPSTFQATVEIKAGPMFDLFAQPWGDAEPIIFQHGIEIGEPLGVEANALVDFATLSDQDWSVLVGIEYLVAASGDAPSQETPATTGLRDILHGQGVRRSSRA